MEGRPFFEALPPEVTAMITRRLPPSAMESLAVSKAGAEVARDQRYWREQWIEAMQASDFVGKDPYAPAPWWRVPDFVDWREAHAQYKALARRLGDDAASLGDTLAAAITSEYTYELDDPDVEMLMLAFLVDYMHMLSLGRILVWPPVAAEPRNARQLERVAAAMGVPTFLAVFLYEGTGGDAWRRFSVRTMPGDYRVLVALARSAMKGYWEDIGWDYCALDLHPSLTAAEALPLVAQMIAALAQGGGDEALRFVSRQLQAGRFI